MARHAPYSTAEKQYWQNMAALLDPDAVVFVNGAGTVATVPAGKRWFDLNHWGILSSSKSIAGTVTVVSGVSILTATTASDLPVTDAGKSVWGPGANGRFIASIPTEGTAILNAGTANSGSYQIYTMGYQRIMDADYKSVIPLGAGSELTIGPGGGYFYLIKPELVIPAPYGSGDDTRYVTDPKKLYYERLAILETLPIQTLPCLVSPGAAAGSTKAEPFPATFDKGLVVGAYSQDGAWVGFNSPTLGSMNVMDELSDRHQTRFARAVRGPFKRTVFPNFLVSGASIYGDALAPVGTGYGAANFPQGVQGGCYYYKLPEDW